MKKIISLFILLMLIQYSIAQKDISIIESNNRFTFDIYKKLKKQESNMIFSPSSITSAIAMTYIGAKNNTFNEIANTFYFNTDISSFSKDYKSLFEIKNYGKNKFSLYNANSLWIQNGLVLNKDFLENNNKYFSSSLHYTDYIKDSESSRLSINKWVEDNTNNRIKDLLKANTISKTTRLVLVNAIYFKASWKNTFDKKQNTSDKFQIGKKEYVKTDFMNRYINSWYYEDRYSQIIDIPYSSSNYSMMIIVPKSFRKFKKVEKKLDYEFYTNYIQKKEMTRINLSLPKFKMESEYDLNSILRSLGVKEAFSGEADFSGITESEKLFISKVVHKANISIDEEGTEAAAATAVSMEKTSFLSDEFKVNINKPFIYLIRNNENNTIYFIGKVINTKNLQNN